MRYQHATVERDRMLLDRRGLLIGESKESSVRRIERA
jgi:hypothetical protein